MIVKVYRSENWSCENWVKTWDHFLQTCVSYTFCQFIVKPRQIRTFPDVYIRSDSWRENEGSPWKEYTYVSGFLLQILYNFSFFPRIIIISLRAPFPSFQESFSLFEKTDMLEIEEYISFRFACQFLTAHYYYYYYQFFCFFFVLMVLHRSTYVSPGIFVPAKLSRTPVLEPTKFSSLQSPMCTTLPFYDLVHLGYRRFKGTFLMNAIPASRYSSIKLPTDDKIESAAKTLKLLSKSSLKIVMEFNFHINWQPMTRIFGRLSANGYLNYPCGFSKQDFEGRSQAPWGVPLDLNWFYP